MRATAAKKLVTAEVYAEACELYEHCVYSKVAETMYQYTKANGLALPSICKPQDFDVNGKFILTGQEFVKRMKESADKHYQSYIDQYNYYANQPVKP